MVSIIMAARIIAIIFFIVWNLLNQNSSFE